MVPDKFVLLERRYVNSILLLLHNVTCVVFGFFLLLCVKQGYWTRQDSEVESWKLVGKYLLVALFYICIGVRAKSCVSVL